MKPRRAFPRDIPDNPSTEELNAYLGDLLDWLAKRKRLDLMQAGFTEPELFDLKRVGNAYRTGNLNLEILSKANELFSKLESVNVQV